MGRTSIWVVSISIILLLQNVNSTDEEVKQLLLVFFQRLSNGSRPSNPNFGWNDSSDPCSHGWSGVTCYGGASVKRIMLEGLGFNGTFDANSICAVQSLSVLSVRNNSIQGLIPEDIANCKQLTHLFINNNRFSGSIPMSLSGLNNLKRLDVSNNMFISQLPDLSKISGLLAFYGQSNHFTGGIAGFNFAFLQNFNVSFNELSGRVPVPASRFDVSSFIGNPGLCGKPLPNACLVTAPAPAPAPVVNIWLQKTKYWILFICSGHG